MCMFISGKRGKIKHKYLQLEIVPSSWSEFFNRLRRSVLQVFLLQAYYQGVPSRLPDLKIAGPFPGYLHKVQCTSAHVQCTKLHTSAPGTPVHQIGLRLIRQLTQYLPMFIRVSPWLKNLPFTQRTLKNDDSLWQDNCLPLHSSHFCFTKLSSQHTKNRGERCFQSNTGLYQEQKMYSFLLNLVI